MVCLNKFGVRTVFSVCAWDYKDYTFADNNLHNHVVEGVLEADWVS